MLRSLVCCREGDGSIPALRNRVARGRRCVLGVHPVHCLDRAWDDGSKGSLVGRHQGLHCCWCLHCEGLVVESRGRAQPPNHCGVCRINCLVSLLFYRNKNQISMGCVGAYKTTCRFEEYGTMDRDRGASSAMFNRRANLRCYILASQKRKGRFEVKMNIVKELKTH